MALILYPYIFATLMVTVILPAFVVEALSENDFTCSETENGQQCKVDCTKLLSGQFYCEDPEISMETQEAVGCTRENIAKTRCHPADENLRCVKGMNVNGTEQFDTFERDIPCRWTNGKRFDTALLLSVFTGWLGLDRFYLGYPALGLLKLSTFGFMFLGSLLDVILIAAQVVGPADGSHYIISYYGPILTRIQRDNDTYLRPIDYDTN